MTEKTPLQDSIAPELRGLTKLGQSAPFRYDSPRPSILEAFPNPAPGRDYVIAFEFPEFTSLCPMTGQPDFGTIRMRYVAEKLCVESKSFKLYMGAFRNHGAFMENLVNTMADDLIGILAPRRLTLEGVFNARGGVAISIKVEHLAQGLSKDQREHLASLW